MSRRELEALFNTEQYYFHGSDMLGLAELEPRQAYSHGKPDGEPAVHAAPAIFMATLGKRAKAGWNSQKYGGFFGFFVTQDSYRQAVAENWQGAVYALHKKDFDGPGISVSKASRIVPVVHELLVSMADLDMNIITLIDDEISAAQA